MGKASASFLTVAFEAAIGEAGRGIRLKHGGPFGAAIVLGGRVFAVGHNTVLRDHDPSAHAEVNAIRAACRRLKKPHLHGATLVATSEPCPMCLATAYWAGIKEIRYALPVAVAAKYGFGDVAYAEDIAKHPSHRRLPLLRDSAFVEGALAVFVNWKRGKGKTY